MHELFQQFGCFSQAYSPEALNQADQLSCRPFGLSTYYSAFCGPLPLFGFLVLGFGFWVFGLSTLPFVDLVSLLLSWFLGTFWPLQTMALIE